MACKARNSATKVNLRLRAAGMDDEVLQEKPNSDTLIIPIECSFSLENPTVTHLEINEFSAPPVLDPPFLPCLIHVSVESYGCLL
jgi:hypothetical protein